MAYESHVGFRLLNLTLAVKGLTVVNRIILVTLMP